MQSILGIDVSKSTLDVKLIAESCTHHKTVRNTSEGFQQLEKWLVDHKAGQTHTFVSKPQGNMERRWQNIYSKGDIK